MIYKVGLHWLPIRRARRAVMLYLFPFFNLSYRYAKFLVWTFLPVLKIRLSLSTFIWQLCQVKRNERKMDDCVVLCVTKRRWFRSAVHTELEDKQQVYLNTSGSSRLSGLMQNCWRGLMMKMTEGWLTALQKAVQMIRMCNCVTPEEE